MKKLEKVGGGEVGLTMLIKFGFVLVDEVNSKRSKSQVENPKKNLPLNKSIDSLNTTFLLKKKPKNMNITQRLN